MLGAANKLWQEDLKVENNSQKERRLLQVGLFHGQRTICSTVALTVFVLMLLAVIFSRNVAFVAP